MSSFLAASSPSSLAEVWVIAIAAIGGMIVFAGLLIEKIAEWKSEKHIVKPCKGLSEWGWGILMAGIAIEIGVAVWSATDAWQTRQAAIKNDPLNQPIASMTATISLALSGQTNRANDGRITIVSGALTNGIVMMDFCRLDQVKPGINFNSYSLSCSSWANPITNWWSFKLDTGMNTYLGPPARVRDVKDWNVVEIFVPFLQPDAEIVGGRIVLIVNSTPWSFEIPPQRVSAGEECVNFRQNPHAAVIVFGK